MRKKNKILLIALIVVAALGVAAVAVVLGYNHVDHGNVMSKSEVEQYNAAITSAAQSYKAITTDEFVVIDTVSKELGGHTEVTYRIYRVPEGGKLADYLFYRVSDLPKDFAPDYIGDGTARLVNGSMDRIIVNIAYFK